MADSATPIANTAATQIKKLRSDREASARVRMKSPQHPAITTAACNVA